MILRVIIIEDDELQLNAFKVILNQIDSNINIIGTTDEVDKALLLINDKYPDLVFLDIELDNKYRKENGLLLFQKIFNQKHHPIVAIFTSFFDVYSVKTSKIKMNHLDKTILFIEKPYQIDKLEKVINFTKETINNSLTNLYAFKIANNETEFVEYKNIISLFRWEDKYCKILYFKNEEVFEKGFSGEFTKEAEKINHNKAFMYARKACLINIYQIIKLEQAKGKIEIILPHVNKQIRSIEISENYLPIWKNIFDIKRAKTP